MSDYQYDYLLLVREWDPTTDKSLGEVMRANGMISIEEVHEVLLDYTNKFRLPKPPTAPELARRLATAPHKLEEAGLAEIGLDIQFRTMRGIVTHKVSISKIAA